MMRVLVACEFSGVVREAFRRRGHDAWSCDLLPAADGSRFHHQGDVLDLLTSASWDLMIAHPPCIYLTNSGVRWLHSERDRWQRLIEAAVFFRDLLYADVPRIAVENPVMHRYAAQIIGRRQDQVIQPWQFGHGEVKATGLWLRNLPPLVPTDVVAGRTPRIHRMPPSPDRGKLRSITYAGIAEAMAAQWGSLAIAGAAA